MISDYKGISPTLASSVYIAPTAVVIGDVTIGEGSSVWFNCVLRGDEHPIRIGIRTNIQDMTTCHTTSTIGPLIIGDEVTIGHRAIVHGCTIGDGSMIGMGAIVMDGAVIGEGSIVAAGAVVLENTVIPPGSMVAGMPGMVKREVTDQDRQMVAWTCAHYVEKGGIYSEMKTQKG